MHSNARCALLAAAVGLAACAPNQPGRTERTASSVVTLVPAATDIVRALGAHAALVGRTLEDSALDVRSLPTVGRVLEPSLERILALEPDVVIAWADARDLITRLTAAGTMVYPTRFDRIADIATHTRGIGALLGHEQRADSIADRITQQLAQLRQQTDRPSRPSVLYVLQTEPLWTAGPGTFVDDLIQVAGGRNVFADLPVAWSVVALEAVAQRQPDVIIVAQARTREHAGAWLHHPAWRRLRAVRSQRLYIVNADQYNRPDTRVVETAHELARLLQPQDSSDV